MNPELILDGLNDAQREAVTAPPGAVLVLAGAGSGKTRVLTRRIAWLIATEGVAPEEVLAVTFTNKAASEMRGRVERLLERPAADLWIGTFHGLAHRMLRRHHEAAGLPQGFQILDSGDQQRLIRRLLKSIQLSDKEWPPRRIAGIIGRTKDEGRRLLEVQSGNDPRERTLAKILAAYDEACERAGLVDFAELLLRATRMLTDNPDIAERYAARFRHILVDEFQDTNTVQYLWVRALAGQAIKPFIVGDDDQSIYGWRGAQVENLQRFQHDYGPVKVVRLEQNYRSTGHILSAANAVIAKNSRRMGKNLWTEGVDGPPIALYAASDERDEASHIVARIERWIADGGTAGDAAVLYRSNAQSRMFEETLIARGIPYRVYGGLRFFERAEIKDALAYLRLAIHRGDDVAFERIVNVPARGIGQRSMETLRTHARRARTSLWEAAGELARETSELSGRARNALANFIQLAGRMSEEVARRDLGEAVEYAIGASGLDKHHGAEGGEIAQGRLENLAELVNAARDFSPDDDLEPLESFLARAALEAGDNQAAEWANAAKLMTLHSAKGLEFPLVAIAGLEEGLFPHAKSIEAPKGLEEERRLFYVGMTRAREQLLLTHAERRRLHGQLHYSRPSRFLAELPEENIEEIGPRRGMRQPRENGTSDAARLGRRVRHASFGEGVILEQEGDGARMRLKIAFADAGVKWLVAHYARLEMLP
ncbi:MAG: DNA helicase II [Gammaproteobacteria bacterium]|nr:DNA helicase II [Gammaproteobacteria bacterium]